MFEGGYQMQEYRRRIVIVVRFRNNKYVERFAEHEKYYETRTVLQTVRGTHSQEDIGGGQQNESSSDFYSKIDKIIRRKQTLLSYEEKRKHTLLH
jgi:hypothetical protein